MPFGVPDFHALHIEQGMDYFWRNDFHTALVEFDQALQIRESAMARFDRAHTLLALGRYAEGWQDFAAREQLMGDAVFTESSRRIRRELPRWNGEPGHRVVLLHEAGFGDSIMFLRFRRLMRERDPVSVVLDVPEPLRVLASQVAPIGTDGDCWLSLFDLPALFDPVIPAPPYLKPDAAFVAHWRSKVSNGATGSRIGIAWSSNSSHVGEHELYQQRSIPIEQFVQSMPLGCTLFSLQHHERELAERCGVHAPELKDFADVAALASLMDVVVSIDTAALHVAGAIGHPNTYAILPYAPTWRWHRKPNPWYPNVKLCQAQAPGDWSSAFAQCCGSFSS
jgi:hypothetical protein